MNDKFTILAAIDLEEGSSAVVEEALDQARGRKNCELHILTVREPLAPVATYPLNLAPAFDAPTAEATAEFCRQLLQARAPEAATPSIQVHATPGLPADEIIWFAAHINADSIVVSTHGRRGIKRLLLGSVAEKVVRLAGCPVTVVRPKSHASGDRVPDIEPLCPDCANKRFETRGAELWCARHSEHHVRAHVRSYHAAGDEPPHAWNSSTGT